MMGMDFTGTAFTLIESRNGGTHSRFTLIELLVVIAIIAILMSILMPALSSARDSGKRIACMNNLKQLGFATNMYIGDYDEFLPASFDDNYSDPLSRTNGHVSQGTWATRLAPHLDVKLSDTSDPRRYFKSESKVFRCPADPRDFSTANPSTYSHSEWITRMAPLRHGWLRRGKVSDLAQGMDQTGWLTASPVTTYLQTLSFKVDQGLYMDYNFHQNGRNVLLLDGHAEWGDYKKYLRYGGERYHIFDRCKFYK